MSKVYSARIQKSRMGGNAPSVSPAVNGFIAPYMAGMSTVKGDDPRVRLFPSCDLACSVTIAFRTECVRTLPVPPATTCVPWRC